jgi:hypothetical protein
VREVACEMTYIARQNGFAFDVEKMWLMSMYAKNVREDIDVKNLRKIRETFDGKAQRKGTGKVRG